MPGSNYSTNKIPIGWINTFPGITLCSKKQSDGHYHCHNLGNFNGNSENLYNCIGKEYQCSCYFIRNVTEMKRCNESFIFENGICIYKYGITINQIPISASDYNVYFFNLKKSKKFITYHK